MPYSQWIKTAAEIQESIAGDAGQENAPRFSIASFSIPFKTKKLGVHCVSLPPACRSSLPHAESLEEEFVYVVQGSPHVWIDGYIHKLHPGYAVGFPAGTGIAHNFINNTNAPCTLAVVGDRTLDDNLCSFPVNPEQVSNPIFWKNAPQRQLGPNSGLPGDLSGEKDATMSDAIVDAAAIERKATFFYKEDPQQETFSDGVRLTDKLGLKSLGIWHERLAPKKRSSFPHAHKIEEEFAYVLSGEISVWLNGYVYKVGPNTGIFFPPGSGIAHTLINCSDEPAEYLGIGQADDGGAGERIRYPLHPARNEGCREKGWLWEDMPTDLPFGNHPATP